MPSWDMGGLEVRGSSEQSTAIVCKVKKLAFMFTTQRCFSFLMKVGKQFVQKETAGENENKKREEEGAHHLRCKCKIYARLTLPLILCPEILCCFFAFFMYLHTPAERKITCFSILFHDFTYQQQIFLCCPNMQYSNTSFSALCHICCCWEMNIVFFSCLQTIIKAEPSKCVMKLQLILIGHQMWPRWERRTAYVYKDLGQAL